MGRKSPDGFVHKDTLIQKLKNFDVENIDTLSKDALVWEAFDRGLITECERDVSFTRRISVIPCYLYTYVENETIRSALENYVQCATMLYSRGSFLANLAAISVLQVSKLPKDILDIRSQSVDIPSFLLDENLVKHCFLPERWLYKGLEIDSLVASTFELYSDLLDDFLPDYNKVMCDSGWDNALNHMGTNYLGNVKVQVLSHLYRRLVSYVKEVHPVQSGTLRHALNMAVFGPLQTPLTDIHNDDFEWALALQKVLGINDRGRSDQWVKEWQIPLFKELSKESWTLHLWLQSHMTQGKNFSILPVSNMSRRYCYVDAKIASFLIPSKTKKSMQELTKNDVHASELQRMFGLTRRCFNKRRQKVRKDLRNKYKDNKRFARKWKNVGAGCLPPHGRLKMLETDGVGLRLYLEFPKNERLCTKKQQDVCNDNYDVLVAADTGRVRIGTFVDDRNKVTIISRKAYLYAQRDIRRKAWEKQRMTNTPWGVALAAQAEAGGFKNRDPIKWTATLDALRTHLPSVLEEQLYNKDRARIKMCLFRWKRSFMDTRLKQVLDPAIKKKKRMLVGIGKADFASHGPRGEIATPTTKTLVDKHFKRVLKIHQLSERVKIDNTLDEYNTTKCCHCCGHVMDILTTCHEKDCLRYRLCMHCSHARTVYKRRNRDVNAARNILKVLQSKVMGMDRPSYLARPIRMQGQPSRSAVTRN